MSETKNKQRPHPNKSIESMAESMDALFAECRGTRDAGQKEYAGGDNAFGNFNRLSEQTGLTPETVLWIYFVKHTDGILSWVRGHRSQREPIRGRIKDAIVYLSLLAGMAEEYERVKTEAVAEPRSCPPPGGLSSSPPLRHAYDIVSDKCIYCRTPRVSVNAGDVPDLCWAREPTR